MRLTGLPPRRNGSWRSAPLPRNWATTRRRILSRDGHRCTAMIDDLAKVQGKKRCNAPANEVDHIIPVDQRGGEHDGNLTSLCAHHHRRKTGREARASQLRRTPPRSRPEEEHPGARLARKLRDVQ